MEHCVTVTVLADEPLSDAVIAAVATVGDATIGAVGGRRLGTTLTIDTRSPAEAGRLAVHIITAIAPGTVDVLDVEAGPEPGGELQDVGAP